jgi:hypothetical protein
LGVVLCQAAAARVPSGLPRVPRPAARLCDRGWRTVRPLWRRVCKTTGWLTVRPLRRRVCKTTGWRTVRPLRRRVCKRWWFGSNWWHWHWHLALAAVGLGSSGHWLDIDFGIGVQMHSQSLCLRLGLVQDAQFHSSCLRLGLVQDAQSLGLAATGGIGIGTWHWQKLAWAAVGIGYDPLLRPCFLQQFLGENFLLHRAMALEDSWRLARALLVGDQCQPNPLLRPCFRLVNSHSSMPCKQAWTLNAQ